PPDPSPEPPPSESPPSVHAVRASAPLGAAGRRGRRRAQLMEHLGAGTLRLLHEPLTLPEEGRRIVVHLPA
ncbi:hypothetical protein ACWDX8_36955, partial [Streptomyces anthocyanicus]